MLRKILAVLEKDREERGIPVIAQIVAFPLVVVIAGFALVGLFPLLLLYVVHIAIVASPFFIYYLMIHPLVKRLRSCKRFRRGDSF